MPYEIDMLLESACACIHCTLVSAVLPATPSNVTISTINSSHVAVTWSLCPQAPDESPDAFTLELMTLDGASVSTHHVQGDSRLAEVRVTAGTDYRLRLASVNMDGTVSAAPVLFSAPPEGQRSRDCGVAIYVARICAQK